MARRGLAVVAVGFAALGAAFGALGCAETQARPRAEDSARAMAFVPTCTRPLRTDVRPTADAGTQRRGRVTGSLRDDDIIGLAFPTYDALNKQLPRSARACDGRALLDHPYLAGLGEGGPAPIFLPEGRTTLSSASDGLKIAWIRTHTLGDGLEAGPLFLLHVADGGVEIVAAGVHRGLPARTRLSTARLGTEIAIVATEDPCVGLPKTSPCLAQTTVLVPRSGELVLATVVDLERRFSRVGGEPGFAGNVHYRLGTAVTYLAGGLRVLEQVDALDDAGRTLRRAEAERAFALRPDGTLQTDDPPLWTRVVGGP